MCTIYVCLCLYEGCVDYFNSADRRHWARTLAEQTRPGQLDLLLVPVEEAWGAEEEDEEEEEEAVADKTSASGGLADTGGGAVRTMKDILAGSKRPSQEQEQQQQKPAEEKELSLASTTAWSLGEAKGGDQGTFREALRQLRDAYPAGLHAYGLRAEEHGVYMRVSEMRRQLQRITDTVEARAREASSSRGKRNIGSSGEGSSTGTAALSGGSPTKINLYASSLTNEVSAP